MAERFTYHVMPDPDGWGWVVAAEGYVTRSLPYGTKEEAIEVAEALIRRHPGSMLLIDHQPPRLTPIEIEHRMAA